MAVELSIAIKEGQELAAKYTEGSVRRSVEKPFKDLVLGIERDVKKAAVIDTGRFRASIASKFLGEMSAVVGTNVQYAPFLEIGSVHGQTFVPPRHMEGATKELGIGAFAFVLENSKELLKDFETKSVSNLEKELT